VHLTVRYVLFIRGIYLFADYTAYVDTDVGALQPVRLAEAIRFSSGRAEWLAAPLLRLRALDGYQCMQCARELFDLACESDIDDGSLKYFLRNALMLCLDFPKATFHVTLYAQRNDVAGKD
jgi:hypothetical protein